MEVLQKFMSLLCTLIKCSVDLSVCTYIYKHTHTVYTYILISNFYYEWFWWVWVITYIDIKVVEDFQTFKTYLGRNFDF